VRGSTGERCRKTAGGPVGPHGSGDLQVRPPGVQDSHYFPQVRTAFLDPRKGEVEIHRADFAAEIRPNAGNLPAYPKGPPEVNIFLPGEGFPRLVPHLPGLYWFDQRLIAQKIQRAPSPMQPVINMQEVGLNFGRPCLWRNWNMDCDFIFIARQVHRMLTDPGAYSPGDCMNPEAALYWAAHKNELPLEPPIPEIGGYHEGHAGSRAQRGQFSLMEVR